VKTWITELTPYEKERALLCGNCLDSFFSPIGLTALHNKSDTKKNQLIQLFAYVGSRSYEAYYKDIEGYPGCDEFYQLAIKAAKESGVYAVFRALWDRYEPKHRLDLHPNLRAAVVAGECLFDLTTGFWSV